MNIKPFVGTVILSATLQPPFAAPCNRNATVEAKALLRFLIDISGKRILSGQESMFSDGTFPSTRDQYVHRKTGKYPAIYNSDFGDVGTGNLSDRLKVVSNIQNYAEKGSIIALQYHMIQPDLADGAGFSAMNIKGSTYTGIPEILTEGSVLNTTFKKRLDELAGYFTTLEKSKIAVMWRPFHEMNGDFFWWSYQDRFKELWIYTWKYLTETKKCNNLLWVFGANYYASAAPTSKASPAFYYPGHEYVDILGCDFYTRYGHSYDKRIYDELLTLGSGKPIGISENGTMPDIPAIRTGQPKWAFWSTWWGFEGSGEGNTDALYQKNYSDAAVITQDEVPTEKLHPTTIEVRTLPGSQIAAARVPLQVSVSGGVVTLSGADDCEQATLHSPEGTFIASLRNTAREITLPDLPAGMYLVTLIQKGRTNTLRIAICR